MLCNNWNNNKCVCNLFIYLFVWGWGHQHCGFSNGLSEKQQSHLMKTQGRPFFFFLINIIKINLCHHRPYYFSYKNTKCKWYNIYYFVVQYLWNDLGHAWLNFTSGRKILCLHFNILSLLRHFSIIINT